MDHDSGVFRINASGNYTFHLSNENVGLETDLEYQLYTYTPPLLNFSSLIIATEPIYETHQFEVTITVQNLGGSSEESIILSPILPEGLSLAPGETFEKNISELGYLDNFSASWQLVADSSGNFSVDIQCSTEFEGILHKNQDVEITIDDIDPVLSLISPVDGIFSDISSVTLTWTGSDDESGLMEYNIYVNGAFNVTLDELDTSYEFTSLSHGAYYNFTIEAIDNEENAVNRSAIIGIDLLQPSISFSIDSTWIAPDIDFPVSYFADDEFSGINKVIVSMRESSGDWMIISEQENLSSTIILEVNYPTYTGSTVEFKMKAEDRAGNIIESEILTVNVDSDKPNLSFNSITSDSLDNFSMSGIITFNISVSDGTSGISSVVLKFEMGNQTFVFSAVKTGNCYLFSFDSMTYVETLASISVSVIATDIPGNNNSISMLIAVDNTNPQNIGFTGEILTGIGVMTILGVILWQVKNKKIMWQVKNKKL